MTTQRGGMSALHPLDAIKAVTPPAGGVLICGPDGGLLTALLAAGIDARAVVPATDEGVGPVGRMVCGCPEALPFGGAAFATVAVCADRIERQDEARLGAALAEIVRVARETVILAISGAPFEGDECGAARPRTWWEQRLFAHGLRRHTRFFDAVSFEALEDEQAPCLVLQKIPEAAALAHPLASLAAERDLHMDMLRETGRRSDAHLARYEWARQWIKPGDVVVDAACGLGYGSAMLWDGSEASRVTGLDISDSAIAYARDCFLDGRPGLDYWVADAEAWDGWADHSVDCIVSFETIEHVADPGRFLRGARRVLKPGGRFLCSIPNEWVDDTGTDPNPFHLHVFNLDRLVALVAAELLVDEAYAQSAGGHAQRFEPRRMLRNAAWPDVDPALQSSAEWWLLSAVNDPLPHAAVPYVEQVFPAETADVPNVIAFARDYINPWAVHSLVLGCFRVRSKRLLRTLAERWLAMSPPDSADAGAALCILADRELDDPAAGRASTLLERVACYCGGPVANVQGIRWQISLRFVEGLLRMHRGELAAAERAFRICAGADPSAFTPHLETKATEAAWHAGRLALERGDLAAAGDSWRLGLAALERIRAVPVDGWLVTPRRPAAFEAGDGLREITIAVDNATLCANGLRKLADDPGEWRPGPGGLERNLQRHIARLADDAGRAWASAREGWRAAEQSWADHRRTTEDWQTASYDQVCGYERRIADLEARRRVELQAFEESARAREQAREQALLQASVRSRTAVRAGIFGTGAGAMKVARALARLDDVVVVWFADNNTERHGKTMLWLDVIAPGEIALRHWDVIVIGSMSALPIRTQLVSLGVPADRIVSPDVTAAPENLLAQLRASLAVLV